MRIVVDENIERSIVEQLKSVGCEVIRIAEIAKSCSDIEVLRIAEQYGALLLTEDKDFGELVTRNQRQAPGVLLVRLQGFSSLEKAEIVTEVVREQAEELLTAFTVLSPKTVRIRFYKH